MSESWPFRERIDRRAALWWQERPSDIHGPRECHALRKATDDDVEWKCCRFWQRKLANKWNSREFAKKHGIRVPHLLWSGRDVDAIPFERLSHAYVIRLTSGHSGAQVMVMVDGVNLLDQKAYSDAAVRERFKGLLTQAFSRTLMLVEEYVPPLDPIDGSGLPPNYRFHMIGDVVAWVSVSCARRNFGHFTPAWQPFELQVMRSVHAPYPWRRPDNLEALLDTARTLGRAFGSYVRVDLYDTGDGPVFAEFAPVPSRGRAYTRDADARLSELWTKHLPDAV